MSITEPDKIRTLNYFKLLIAEDAASRTPRGQEKRFLCGPSMFVKHFLKKKGIGSPEPHTSPHPKTAPFLGTPGVCSARNRDEDGHSSRNFQRPIDGRTPCSCTKCRADARRSQDTLSEHPGLMDCQSPPSPPMNRLLQAQPVLCGFAFPAIPQPSTPSPT